MKVKNTILTLVTCCFCIALQVNANTSTSNKNVKNPTTAAKQEQPFEHIVKLLPEDFRPAFTRETVIKLNTIVKRSYAVINEFDALTKELENSLSKVDNATPESKLTSIGNKQMLVLKTLEIRSKSALTDMMKAVATLKASDEYYNSAVLAGMVKFVKTVEQEVNDQSVFLNELLTEA